LLNILKSHEWMLAPLHTIRNNNATTRRRIVSVTSTDGSKLSSAVIVKLARSNFKLHFKVFNKGDIAAIGFRTNYPVRGI